MNGNDEEGAETEENVATSKTGKAASKLAHAPPSNLVQARFARAVSELQFLGFVKHTGRKADHVARLTWGSV